MSGLLGDDDGPELLAPWESPSPVGFPEAGSPLGSPGESDSPGSGWGTPGELEVLSSSLALDGSDSPLLLDDNDPGLFEDCDGMELDAALSGGAISSPSPWTRMRSVDRDKNGESAAPAAACMHQGPAAAPNAAGDVPPSDSLASYLEVEDVDHAFGFLLTAPTRSGCTASSSFFAVSLLERYLASPQTPEKEKTPLLYIAAGALSAACKILELSSTSAASFKAAGVRLSEDVSPRGHKLANAGPIVSAAEVCLMRSVDVSAWGPRCCLGRLEAMHNASLRAWGGSADPDKALGVARSILGLLLAEKRGREGLAGGALDSPRGDAFPAALLLVAWSSITPRGEVLPARLPPQLRDEARRTAHRIACVLAAAEED